MASPIESTLYLGVGHDDRNVAGAGMYRTSRH